LGAAAPGDEASDGIVVAIYRPQGFQVDQGVVMAAALDAEDLPADGAGG